MDRRATLTETRPQPGARLAPSRRDVLRRAGIVAVSGGAVLTLAACGADGQAGEAVPTSSAPSGAAPSAASPSAPASESGSASSQAAPDGPSVDTADVPVGGGVILDDADYVVTQPTEGTFKAFSKICTHQGCPVTEVASDGIECRCHGSVFSITDGSVVNPPASRPLAESATTVVGARVYVTG